jgi:hypothetical protein
MSKIASQSDIGVIRGRRPRHWRTAFWPSPPDAEDAPMAFFVEEAPGHFTLLHFHGVDQFEVTMGGSGTLGKHQLAMHKVRFSKGRTPYGPIVAGSEGLIYLTLRARWDKGAQYPPESRERLVSLKNRRPKAMSDVPQSLAYKHPIRVAAQNSFRVTLQEREDGMD